MYRCCQKKDSQNAVLLPRCHFCGKVPVAGIKGGWKIKKVFICWECENKIINLDIGSSDYMQVVEKLRKIIE